MLLAATLIEATININSNLLAAHIHNQKANNYLAITLNHLKDKKAWCQLLKDFPSLKTVIIK